MEPLDPSSTDARTAPRNKWIRYQKGMHTPRSALVSRINKRMQNSERELNHPLWGVLSTGEACVPDIDNWFRTLDPKVQLKLYGKLLTEESNLEVKPVFSKSLGLSLVRFGNLDSLTALLLFWFEASQNNDANKMQQLAEQIYMLLLVQGMEFTRRNLAEDIFQIFKATVFERTPWKNAFFALNEAQYQQGAQLLYLLLFQVDDADPFSTWAKRCQVMLALLNGKKGLDVQFGLRILLLPNWKDGPPSYQQLRNARKDYISWLWGWTHLNQGTIGKFPYDELWHRLEITCEW